MLQCYAMKNYNDIFLFSEFPDEEPTALTTAEYAALLKKAANHLARIAQHKLVNDPSLVSDEVKHIIDTPVAQLVKEVSPEDNPDDDSDVLTLF